ncbi:LysM peptidoglycan-binding domain-containing protein [Priestia taiwanensis]|uniref:Peptidase M23 n=1 Tax=Priestia taiwanensis TaxID=1347902 RepID=A0A917AJE9_9BACI|nr:LysM peptidoglycan-binding domain-containing protein [Priestia taiwanensis]MBM7361637.1 LysM repeat protein [Priestia taiwanensis]GGE55728.1 peptidase M23 [Priestia taiwanensis]
MTKKDEKLDQAEILRKRMSGPTEEAPDMLHLPPRSEKHVEEEKKTRWRIKHPIVRLLAICFILIPGTIVAYIIHQHNKQETVAPNHYERVTVNKGNTNETQKKEEPVAEAKEETKEETKPVEEPAKEDQPEKKEEPPKQDNMIYHTVKEGDTLYSLAMKYFGNRNGERVIEEYNQLESRDLVVGSVLEIPKDVKEIVK